MRCIVRFVTSLSFFPLLWGCTQGLRTPKDTAVVGISSHPSTLDPRFATDAYGMRITSLVFQSLVKVGPQLTVIGDAADSWSLKGTTYTFLLKKGLRFCNGRPVEAEDLLFTFKEFQKNENPFRSSLQLLKKISVEKQRDRLEVKLELSEFSAKLLVSDLPMIKILPAKEIQENPKGFSKKILGSGPFCFEKKNGNSYFLKKNNFFSEEQPHIDKLEFKVVKNDFTLYQKMKKGSIDLIQAELPYSKVKEFKKSPQKFTVHEYPGLTFSYLLLNFRDPLIPSLEFRKGLDQAIHRQEIIQYKLEGYGRPATSLMTPENPFFLTSLKNSKASYSQARSHFKKANALGKKISLKTSSHPQAIENAKMIAHQLEKAGLKVDLQSYEWGVYFSDVQKGRFQLATMRWIGAIDPDLYRIAFHSNEIGDGRNRGAYINKQLDNLLDKGLRIKNEQLRIDHYYKVQKIIYEDLATIPLWYDQQIAVVNNRLKNYVPSRNGDFSSLMYVSKDKNE
ncbi:MAG: ABC transporter substrate-binding protein [Bdellovibrionales bacterium]|nr:ABC transporter substrate-binding protein [Bdellovibrionales bacterium]